MPEVKIPDTARELIPADSLNLLTQVQLFCDTLVAVEIQNPDQYDNAGETAKKLQKFGDVLEDNRAALKKPYDDKGTAIQNAFMPIINAVTAAKRMIKGARWTYEDMLEQKRRAEQERLNREAEERRRAAEEAARKEREKAEALRQQGRDDLAEKAEARADAKENKAAEIMPSVAQAAIPAAAPRGLARRVNWKGVVDDPVVFKKHCINEGLHDFLFVDEKAWNNYAKIKKEVTTLPGARIIKEYVG
jgi:hypothetical protein